MYTEIEKKYIKSDPYKKFDKYYWTCSAFLVPIFIFLSTLKISNFILMPIFILTLICLIIIYLVNDINRKLNKSERNNKFLKKLKLYFNNINERLVNNLVEILKSENINKKKDIETIINYYNKKSPVIIKNNVWEKISAFAITISSFIVIGYSDETKQMDYEKFAIVLGSTFGIVLFSIILIFLFKAILNEIKPPKERLYATLEEKLTYIYINYDKYKNQLNKKS